MTRAILWAVAGVATAVAVACVVLLNTRAAGPLPEVAAVAVVEPPPETPKPEPEPAKVEVDPFAGAQAFSEDVFGVSTRPASAITPDGKRVVVGVSDVKDGVCVFAGLIERDLATGEEVRRVDLRKQLDPDGQSESWADRMTRRNLVLSRFLFLPNGQLLVAGGVICSPVAVGGCGLDLHRYSSPWVGGCGFPPAYFISHSFESYTQGHLWVIDIATGKLERTVLCDQLQQLRAAELSRDGTKLYVQRWLRKRAPTDDPADPEAVELRRWDTTTWKRDWVKVLDPAEAERVRAVGK
jgi:hypothetical protein